MSIMRVKKSEENEVVLKFSKSRAKPLRESHFFMKDGLENFFTKEMEKAF